MIILLEEPEVWSLMMLASSIAVDNADLSDEGKAAIRAWRSDCSEGSTTLAEMTETINEAMNGHIDEKFTRRVKTRGKRAENLRH